MFLPIKEDHCKVVDRNVHFYFPSAQFADNSTYGSFIYAPFAPMLCGEPDFTDDWRVLITGGFTPFKPVFTQSRLESGCADTPTVNRGYAREHCFKF
jgi:hypothetical protein